MPQDEKFVNWASLFINEINNGVADTCLSGISVIKNIHYTGVTQAACDLLRSVDSGGVPAFITSNLIEIARENGIEVIDHWTPNEII